MKIRLTLLALLPFALLLPGCASYGSSHGDSPRSIGEAEIRAVIVGYESATPPSAGQAPAKVIFVSLGRGTENSDPEPDLFKPVAAAPAGTVQVEPYSACDFQPQGVIDHRTGARGVLLQLGEVRWENDDRATVQATIWIAKGLGAVDVYHLVKKNGRWVIKERQSLGSA